MKFNYILAASIFMLCMLTTMLQGQQDSLLDGFNKNLLDVYNKEVISYGPAFIKNGERLKFKEVRELLLKFPDSSTEFWMYRKKSTVSRVLMIPAALLIPLLATEAGRNGPGYVYGISGFGFIITSAIFSIQSNRHLQQSVWLYNRDVLVEKY